MNSRFVCGMPWTVVKRVVAVPDLEWLPDPDADHVRNVMAAFLIDLCRLGGCVEEVLVVEPVLDIDEDVFQPAAIDDERFGFQIAFVRGRTGWIRSGIDDRGRRRCAFENDFARDGGCRGRLDSLGVRRRGRGFGRLTGIRTARGQRRAHCRRSYDFDGT